MSDDEQGTSRTAEAGGRPYPGRGASCPRFRGDLPLCIGTAGGGGHRPHSAASYGPPTLHPLAGDRSPISTVAHGARCTAAPVCFLEASTMVCRLVGQTDRPQGYRQAGERHASHSGSSGRWSSGPRRPFFTWRNLRVTEQNSRQTLDLSRQGQINDRFTKAIEQLGAVDQAGKKKLEVRLGGVYGLEQIAKESRDYHWPIVEVLTAYVREHAPWKGAEQCSQEEISPSESQPTQNTPSPPKLAADIQAILTMLGRRTRTFDQGESEWLDLRDTDLRGAVLGGAHLEEAVLGGAHLEGAEDLTIPQLATVRTLQGASLDSPLMEQLQREQPELLDPPSAH
jgi:Pentapeptide repeats (8 copies)